MENKACIWTWILDTGYWTLDTGTTPPGTTPPGTTQLPHPAMYHPPCTKLTVQYTVLYSQFEAVQGDPRGR